MASSNEQTKHHDTMQITALLSPPEMKRQDSLNSATTSYLRTPHASFTDKACAFDNVKVATMQGNRHAYASPPISPCQQLQDAHCADEHHGVDPVLFASSDTGSTIRPGEPLFPQSDMQFVLNHHVSKADSRFAGKVSRPSNEEYLLTAYCISRVAKEYNKDPMAWFKREQKINAQYGSAVGIRKRRTLKKIAPAPATGSKRQKIPVPARAPRQPRTAKRSPPVIVNDTFELPRPSHPKPRSSAIDLDFESYPDYSPPLDTLPPGNTKTLLKAEWKGTNMDLSQDPNRHLLHEAELTLASTIRLSCANYLASKRCIFMALIECLKIGKPFRKTDAQQACSIDVNKASRLWVAFDKVGWFDRKHFIQYL